MSINTNVCKFNDGIDWTNRNIENILFCIIRKTVFLHSFLKCVFVIIYCSEMSSVSIISKIDFY